MHRRGWANKGIIIRANKGISLFNCWFDKLLHVAIFAIMMVIARMVLHDINSFSTVGMDFVKKEC